MGDGKWRVAFSPTGGKSHAFYEDGVIPCRTFCGLPSDTWEYAGVVETEPPNCLRCLYALYRIMDGAAQPGDER